MTKLLLSAVAIAMLAMPVLAQTTPPAKDFGTAAAAPAAGTPAAKPAPAPAPTPAAPAKDFGTAVAAPATGTAPATPAATPAADKDAAKAVPAGVVVDKDGKPVPALDKDGKPILDKDGNPVFEKKKRPGGFGDNFLFIMIGMIALMIFMSSRGKKRQKKKQQDMMTSLKKGDRVVSIGGIVGTIVEVKETEIVIKISDTARMRLAKWAIRAAGEEAEDDKAQDTKDDAK